MSGTGTRTMTTSCANDDGPRGTTSARKGLMLVARFPM